jgi:hypothetical protein
MVIRDNKGKPRKKAKPFGSKQSKAEVVLASKLQKESLKMHGDPLDTPKASSQRG